MTTKSLLAIFFVTILNNAIAQKTEVKIDTTEVSVKVISSDKTDSIIIGSNGEKWVRLKTKPKNVITSWWGIDLGFSNYVDNTDYASASAQSYAPGSNAGFFDLRNGKSINVNIWFFNQKVNLIKHVVNLKYAIGLELNNYRYKSNIRYDANPPAVANAAVVNMDVTPNRYYKKNKLAAEYITVPLMLNFNFAPRSSYKIVTSSGKIKNIYNSNYGYGFSAGISAGYLYASRNKFVTSDEGKRKIKDDFELRPWKISYIAELNLGYLSIYGSYATQSMYKRGLDITPYNIGLRFGL